jgi:hypothetical protein
MSQMSSDTATASSSLAAELAVRATMKRSRPDDASKEARLTIMPDFAEKQYDQKLTIRNDSGKRICVSVDNGHGWPWALLPPEGCHEFSSELSAVYVSASAVPEARGANEHLKGKRYPEGGGEVECAGLYKIVSKGKLDLEIIKVVI